MKLFKILKAGRSFHGGDFAYSLPADGKPGEWHEHAGSLRPCAAALCFQFARCVAMKFNRNHQQKRSSPS